MDKESIPYVRIGMQLYKKMWLYDSRGNRYKTIKLWNDETTKRELRKKGMSKNEIEQYLEDIPLYEHHAYVPSHINYEQVVGTQYNLYQELEFESQKGDFHITKKFLRHIFGLQTEIFLDYIQLLYLNPLQILPILILVSKERQTGKTTFFNWLKLLFSSNMLLLEADNLKSRFNSELEGKLIAAIEDTDSLHSHTIMDKIKNYSTAISYQSESKGYNRIETSLFVKFLIASNNEENLLKLESEEIRFWIVKVNTIKEHDRDPNILECLKHEIPAFLYFLTDRNLFTPKPQSRMWFDPKILRTTALELMIKNSVDKIEFELAILLYEIMDSNGLDSLDLCPIDAIELLKEARINVDTSKIRNILKKQWNLSNKGNSFNYQKASISSSREFKFNISKGKFYTVPKNFLLEKFGDLMII